MHIKLGGNKDSKNSFKGTKFIIILVSIFIENVKKVTPLTLKSMMRKFNSDQNQSIDVRYEIYNIMRGRTIEQRQK